MKSDTNKNLVSFFRRHVGDGDFIHAGPDHPTLSISKTDANRSVLYTTKPVFVSRAIEHGSDGSLAIIGGGGLPNDDQIELIRGVCVGLHSAFLGDCDPVDVLIFAVLRERMKMTYIGVNDALISDFDTDVTKNVTVRLSESEMNAIEMLSETCPDYEALIGPNCSALWREGRKLELEAVFNFARVDAQQMCSALSPTLAD